MAQNSDQMNSITLKPINERKPVLGAYAAMARNNAYLTVRDIMEQLHLEQPVLLDNKGKPLDLEAYIWKTSLLNQTLAPEVEAKAAKLLYSHFPFLKAAMDFEKDRHLAFSTVCRCLNNALTVLGHIRDTKLHFKVYEETSGEGYVVLRRAEHFWGKELKNLFYSAPRLLKERYSGTDLLNTDSFDFFMKDRDVPDKHDRHKRVFNKNWLFNPQREAEGDEITARDRNGRLLADPAGHAFKRISEIGEIFTIALFIDKGYTHFLLKDTGLLSVFKETAPGNCLSEQRIVREIFSAYCIRLPERRINTEIDATQIQLDMLNELRKCPSELYDVLPEQERSKFNVISSDGTEVLQKRFSDRYVPMILRFFDSTETFSKLRFQVNAGALRYQLHDAVPYMDGEPRPRIIQEKINAFGRIQDIESKRGSEFSCFGYPLIRENEDGKLPDLPAATDMSARYVLNGEQIGISVRGEVMPEIIKDANSSKMRIANPEPDCWLSKYDLPGLAFYLYLENKYHLEVTAERVISKLVADYRSFFKGVAEGRITSLDDVVIPHKDIPEKLRDYLAGKQPATGFAEYKARSIAKMKKDTRDRLDRIEEELRAVASKDNKPGKKSFVRILPGRIAAFLAEDIVRFQSCPQGHPERRLTGQQFAILQGLIATFSENLAHYCNNAGLLAGELAHPFLVNVFQKHNAVIKDTIGFYVAYLEERLAYLNGNIPDESPFLHAEKTKWVTNKDSAYYRDLAMRYIKNEKTGRDVGIFLPSGLFEVPIREALESCSPRAWQVIANTKRANTAFMILTYFEEELGDLNQDFYYVEERFDQYGFARLLQNEVESKGYGPIHSLCQQLKNGLYKDTILDQINRFKRMGVERVAGPNRKPISSRTMAPLSERLKKAYNHMVVNEKTIRRYMVQDITLFLLSRLQIDKNEGLLLRNLTPDGKGILDQKINVRTRVRIKDRTYLIDQEQVSVKDQGEIHKILKDKRIESLLLNSSGNRPLPLESIKAELSGYNQKRVSVISTIQDYERDIYEKNSSWFEGLNSRFAFRDIQSKDHTTPEIEKQSLRSIRNAFSHNQYPNREIRVGKESARLFNGDMPEIAKEIAGNTELIVSGTKKNK